MIKIMDWVPNVPKKIPILVSKKEILLPGCMKTFALNNDKLKSVLESKFKRKTPGPAFIIGLAQSLDVGTIGTATSIHSFDMKRESITLIGVCRYRIQKISSYDPYVTAEVVQLDFHKDCEDLREDTQIKPLVLRIYDIITTSLHFAQSSTFVSDVLNKIPACYLAELTSQLMDFNLDEQWKLLNIVDVAERLKLAIAILGDKVPVKKTNVVIRTRPIGPQNTEYKKLKTRIDEIEFPPKVKSVVENELKELSLMSPINPQYNILHTHLNVIADLPWEKCVEETINLRKTKEDLEIDHYGLDKVKQRILEYLAVRKLRNEVNKSHQGPILCLFGPPGVGKTSIARSIASTLNRPFERVSLGGVSNMSDIRGHRRTYIGAMPGRIIQAIKRCGVKNPVILLDEIDKMTRGIHGDPGAALLEVLDPTQNSEFMDHYLNIPFDLSQVLFIATANTMKSIASPLFDRLEVIEISGYTYLEKLEIAKKYLLPKQFNETGLHTEQIDIPTDTLQLLINSYTYEAGVRGLERKIGSLCRSVAVKIALNETNDSIINFPVVIGPAEAKYILGPMRRETNKWAGRLGKPGVTVGLVVGASGGDTVAVESIFMPGRGKLHLTGSLGNVMKESAQLAWGWVKSNAHLYGIELNAERLDSIDIHIHFPEGAVPKDGPSAGVTIATTLISLFLDRPLLPNIAMTGEISLQGAVLPVGGIKHKVIAAHKEGFTKIIIPRENEKHLDEIPATIKDDLTFILVSNMHTIIETVFEDGVNLIMPHCAKSKL